MSRSTFKGKVRSYGGRGVGDVTPGVALLSVVVSCNPVLTNASDDAARMRIGTSATEGEVFVLPQGAIVHTCTTIVASTGGSNATIDIGSSSDSNGFFNELDCDSKGVVTGGGGSLIVPAGLSSDTTVTAIAGSSAATGGPASFIITYTIVDDALSGVR